MPADRYRLLIADDDRLLRESMRMALRAQFETTLVSDGLQALNAFRQHDFDAVILDGSMPGMDGPDLCREMRTLPKGRFLPICIVSSAETNEAVDAAFEAGATDYLNKPVHLGLLGRKILHLIRRGQEESRLKPAVMSTDSLFDILPLPVALLDREGRILRSNPAFQAQAGHTGSAASISELLSFDSAPDFSSNSSRTLRATASCQKCASIFELALVPMAGTPAARWVAVLLDVQEPAGSLREIPASPVKSLEGRRVLILEDQDVVARSVDRLLTRAGCRVSITTQGEDTISAYEAAKALGQPFHVVILDLSIPGGIGGTEVVARLAEIDSAVRAIASSGSWDDSAMLSPASHGFVGALPKPFDREQLLREVANAIAQ